MKRGFTLIELLAVIVILSLLSVIVGVGVSKSVKNSKGKLSSTQEKLILEAAEYWASNNLDKVRPYECIYVPVAELENDGYFDDVSELNTEVDRSNYLVKICLRDAESTTEKLEYEFYDISDIASCFKFKNGSITEYYYSVNGHTCPRDVYIPEKISGVYVETITNGAFCGRDITSVYFDDATRLKYIIQTAFSINNIEGVTIPNTIKQLGEDAFSANKIKKVNFEQNSSLETIGENAFIGNFIGEISIPSSVTSIGNYAFKSNFISNLNFEDTSSLVQIGRSAFNFNHIRNVIIPNSVTTIGDNAFGQNGLENVIIGTGIQYLGDWSFCSNYEPFFNDETGVTYDVNYLYNVRINVSKNLNLLTLDPFCEEYDVNKIKWLGDPD